MREWATHHWRCSCLGGGSLQDGVSQAKSDALERQASLDGEVLVDGAAVEPGSLIL